MYTPNALSARGGKKRMLARSRPLFSSERVLTASLFSSPHPLTQIQVEDFELTQVNRTNDKYI